MKPTTRTKTELTMERDELLAALREGTEWLEALPIEILQETEAAEVIENVIVHNRAALVKATS